MRLAERVSIKTELLERGQAGSGMQPGGLSEVIWSILSRNLTFPRFLQKHKTHLIVCKNLPQARVLFYLLAHVFVQLAPVCLLPFFARQLSWLLTKWAICLTQVTITIYQIVFPCSLGSGGAHSATSGLLSALSSSLKRFHAALQSMEPVKRQASLPNSLHQAICTITHTHMHARTYARTPM